MARLNQPVYPSMPIISSKPSVKESAFFANDSHRGKKALDQPGVGEPSSTWAAFPVNVGTEASPVNARTSVESPEFREDMPGAQERERGNSALLRGTKGAHNTLFTRKSAISPFSFALSRHFRIAFCFPS